MKKVIMIVCVIAIVAVTGSVVFLMDSVVLPLWTLLVQWLNAAWKFLTPSNLFSFLQKGTATHVQKKALTALPEAAVQGHGPTRRKLNRLKKNAVAILMRCVDWYRSLNLIIQVGIACALLVLGASTGYVFLAMLVIPQPVINWLKVSAIKFINKTGIAKFYYWLISFILPRPYRIRIKWTIARKKIAFARWFHSILKLINRH